jgi:Carboxypeptidase regulatory-like domain
MNLAGKAPGLKRTTFYFLLVLMSSILTACFFDVTSITVPDAVTTGSVITFTVNASSTSDGNSNRGGVVLEIPAGTQVLRAHYIYSSGIAQGSGDLVEDPTIISAGGYTPESGYQLWAGYAQSSPNDNNLTITLTVWLAVPSGAQTGNYNIKAAVGAYDSTNTWVPQSPSNSGTPIADFSQISGNYESNTMSLTAGSADTTPPADVTPTLTIPSNNFSLDFSSYDEAGQGDVAGYHIYVSKSSFDSTAEAVLLGGSTTPSVLVTGDDAVFGADIGASDLFYFEVPPDNAYPVTIEGLSQNTTYYFAVTAVDVSGNESSPIVVTGDIVSGTITGTVKDGTGTGIPNVIVSVFQNGGLMGETDVVTGGDGSYTVNVPGGSYDVKFCSSCSSLPYADQWYDGAPDQGSATPVTVVPGDVRSGIDATLKAGGTITGTVTYGANGVANLVVLVYDSLSGNYVAEATTGANGSYSVTDLTAWNYYDVKFCSSCSGMPYIDQWYNGAPDEGSATHVTVSAGNTSGGVDATLAMGGSITGTVTDGTNAVANLPVQVYDSTSGNYVAGATTDVYGSYAVIGLPTGNYKVEFCSSCRFFGSLPYINQWYNNKPDQASATPVPVTAGNTVGDINATLVPSGTIFQLSTTLSGPGSGTVTSSPSAIDCGGGSTACSADFASGSVVNLYASPGDACSHFSNWTGYCIGNGSPCTVTMNGDVSVGAVFDVTDGVIIEGQGGSYSLIQDAYNASSESSVLEATAGTYGETLLMDGGNDVTLEGGFDCNYQSNTGGFSVVNGTVTIGGLGSVIVENIAIE